MIHAMLHAHRERGLLAALCAVVVAVLVLTLGAAANAATISRDYTTQANSYLGRLSVVDPSANKIGPTTSRSFIYDEGTLRIANWNNDVRSVFLRSRLYCQDGADGTAYLVVTGDLRGPFAEATTYARRDYEAPVFYGPLSPQFYCDRAFIRYTIDWNLVDGTERIVSRDVSVPLD